MPDLERPVGLHGGLGQGPHDQLLGGAVMHGEGLAKPDNQHGRVLLEYRTRVMSRQEIHLKKMFSRRFNVDILDENFRIKSTLLIYFSKLSFRKLDFQFKKHDIERN